LVRYRTKRPRMAKTAEKWADAIYVTSDNPRTEDPRAILNEVAAGFSPEGVRKTIVEVDRRRAIEAVLADAEPTDVVLIAGKGHENYQIIGSEKQHFDDVEESMRVLQGQAVAA
jgi:UDP-N-acetylmuramoyl-L-alanyl-D-glutamate--2,6-diaminopimelate ligase